MSGYKKPSNDFSQLKKICAAAFASVALVTGLPGCDNSGKPNPPAEEATTTAVNIPEVNKLASRGLTAAEEKLAHQLFGMTIDTNNIAIDFYEESNTGTVFKIACDKTCTIKFFGYAYSKSDYTTENVNLFGIFAHSLTHVWHKQQGDRLRCDDAKGYWFQLDRRFSFDDYGHNQQAAIIEDYARRFLHPKRASRWTATLYGDKGATDMFLRKLVEDKFPSARDARLALNGVESRSLTDDEKNLLRGIFGSEIDVNIIKQVFHSEAMADRVASVNLRPVDPEVKIDYWGEDQHSKNYSCERADNFGVQVHEATHVWQRQTGWAYTRNASNRDSGIKKYLYRLGPDLKFEDYPDERQAAIIEDYARLFLHPKHKTSWLKDTGQWNNNSDASEELLKKVVEDRFPEARKTRLAYEQSVKKDGVEKPYSCSLKVEGEAYLF